MYITPRELKSFCHLNIKRFEFVSNFEIRISDFGAIALVCSAGQTHQKYEIIGKFNKIYLINRRHTQRDADKQCQLCTDESAVGKMSA